MPLHPHWMAGKHTDSPFGGDVKSPVSSRHNGDGKSVAETTRAAVASLAYYEASTVVNPLYYKAWHSWAWMHYQLESESDNEAHPA